MTSVYIFLRWVSHADMNLAQWLEQVEPAILLLADFIGQYWYAVFFQQVTGGLRVTISWKNKESSE